MGKMFIWLETVISEISTCFRHLLPIERVTEEAQFSYNKEIEDKALESLFLCVCTLQWEAGLKHNTAGVKMKTKISYNLFNFRWKSACIQTDTVVMSLQP